MHLRASILEQFSVDLPATAALDFPTIAALAGRVAACNPTHADMSTVQHNSLDPSNISGMFLVQLFCQQTLQAHC